MTETRKVLIIDDEEDFCFFVRENLMHTNMFHVFVATNGRHGIKLAQKELPDIILLDLMMPDMGGEEVAEALQDAAATQDIPIIFVTALAAQVDTGANKLKKSGNNYYLSKPIRTRQLIHAIQEVLAPNYAN